MRLPAIGLVCAALSFFSAFSAHAAETRCGWYVNPTPGNLWLVDKDAAWNLTSQGQAAGPDAADIAKAPGFNPREFVKTNGDYGYGCACLTVETDAKAQRITKVLSGAIEPLARCKNDSALPPQGD